MLGLTLIHVCNGVMVMVVVVVEASGVKMWADNYGQYCPLIENAAKGSIVGSKIYISPNFDKSRIFFCETPGSELYIFSRDLGKVDHNLCCTIYISTTVRQISQFTIFLSSPPLAVQCHEKSVAEITSRHFVNEFARFKCLGKLLSGPLFNKRKDVSPQDLVKSRSCEIRV